MDSAYDAPWIGMHVYLLGNVPIIDFNPRDTNFRENLACETKARGCIGYSHPAGERYNDGNGDCHLRTVSGRVP